jgi:hypothetical protein
VVAVITVGQADISTAMLPSVKLAPHEFLLPTEFSEPYIDPETGRFVEVDILKWEIQADYASAIALELKSMAPRASWGRGPGAYAIGAMFATNGARTMADVRVEPVDPANPEAGFRFDIRGRKVGTMRWEKNGRFSSSPVIEKDSRGYRVGVTARGDGRTHYYLGTGERGLAIFPFWEDTDDTKKILAIAGVVIGVILPLASINFAGSLGSAIMGPSLSAAYPGLTQAIGNVAISTALNGGDVESAVRGAALGAIGSGVGQFVGSNVAQATGVVTLGRVAAAATSALVQGGDPTQAAGWALASAGLRELPDFVSKAYTAINPPESPSMSNLYSLSTSTSSGSGFSFGPGYDFGPSYSSPFDDVGGSGFTLDWSGWSSFSSPFADVGGSGFTLDWSDWSSFGNVGSGWFTPSFDMSSVLFPPSYDVASPPSLTQGSTFDLTPIVNQVSNAAIAALRVYQTYKQVTQAPPQPAARVVNADGSVRAVTDDGFIKTRTPDGRIIVTRPGVNQPVTSVGGFIIVNNGDGTYTRINSAGQRETLRYSSESPGAGLSGANLAVLGALGVGALFLLRK